MAGQPPGSEPSEPTSHARVKLEKSKGKTMADVTVPVDPPPNFIQLITYVVAAVGAVVGPALTFSVLPEGLPTWLSAGAAFGQLAVLISVVLVVRFGRSVERRH